MQAEGSKTRNVTLTTGQIAIVDAVDFERINQYRWRAIKPNAKGNIWYAVTYFNRHIHYMHRVITDAPSGKDVDHINGNGLDNSRVNLRVVTHSQNLWNRRLDKRSTSGHRGLSWDKQSGKWRVLIRVNGQNLTIGRFYNKAEALAAYANAALKYRGEFGTTRAN